MESRINGTISKNQSSKKIINTDKSDEEDDIDGGLDKAAEKANKKKKKRKNKKKKKKAGELADLATTQGKDTTE